MDNRNLLWLLYLRRRIRSRRQNNHRRRQNRRRWWVCPTISRRDEFGAWEHLIQELRVEEPDKFFNYHRVTTENFNWLLKKIEPMIQRSSAVRDPIPSGLKLSLTLRYNMKSLLMDLKGSVALNIFQVSLSQVPIFWRQYGFFVVFIPNWQINNFASHCRNLRGYLEGTAT